MSTVFLEILNMSINASWLIVAVILLRLVLKKAPKSVTCLLWALVGIRLVCPFTIESVFSLVPSTKPISHTIIHSQDYSINEAVDTVYDAVNPVIESATGANLYLLELITYIATGIWLLGITVIAVYGVFSYIKIRRKVSACLHFKDNIYCCDDISTPFIFGIIKPRIFLPSGIDSNQAEFIISHEKAHLKRHDHWWKPLGFVLLAIYWFNPLVWIAYVLLCRDIELACDEAVIKNMDSEYKKNYSNALVDCSTHQHKIIMACPLCFGEVGVKNRIKSVLSYKKPTLWIIIVTVVVSIVVAVTFMTNSSYNPLAEELGKTYTSNDYLEIDGYTNHNDVDIHLVDVDFSGKYAELTIQWENKSGKTFYDDGPYTFFEKTDNGKVKIDNEDVYFTSQILIVSERKQTNQLHTTTKFSSEKTYIVEISFYFTKSSLKPITDEDNQEWYKAYIEFDIDNFNNKKDKSYFEGIKHIYKSENIKYFEEALNRQELFPTLEELGNYQFLRFNFTKKIELIFVSKIYTLKASYNSEDYLQEKEKVLNKYTFKSKVPVLDAEEKPKRTEFQIDTFNFKLLNITNYPKEVIFIGFSDEKKQIAYIYFYDTDLDYIPETFEDFLVYECDWKS